MWMHNFSSIPAEKTLDDMLSSSLTNWHKFLKKKQTSINSSMLEIKWELIETWYTCNDETVKKWR